MAERLFFALWPGDSERGALVELLRGLPHQGGRLTHPEDLHLTLTFLGAVPPERRNCCEAAGSSIQALAFDLSLTCVGYWPRPRILWCGTQVPPDPLLALVQALTDALRLCGFPGERRPYAAHITLARIVAAHNYPDFHSATAWHLDWPVRDFVLAASREGPPPRYRVLRRWPLQSASPACPLCDNAGL